MILYNFASAMKNLVKYLFPVICFAVFFCKADNICFEKQKAFDYCVLEATAADVSSISESEQDICLSRPVTYEAPQSVRNVQRRGEAGQKYSTCTFIKGGKRVSAAGYINRQNNSKQVFSTLAEPAMRLSRLGKLII